MKHQYNPICAGDVTLKRQIAYATSIVIMQVCEHFVVDDVVVDVSLFVFFCLHRFSRHERLTMIFPFVLFPDNL